MQESKSLILKFNTYPYLLWTFLFFICKFTPSALPQDINSIKSSISLFEKSEIIEGKSLNLPYQLQYWPIIPGTDMLWIDGELKTRGIDYSIDYSQSKLEIKIDFRIDSIIKIDYIIIPISIQKTYQRQLFVPLELPSEEKEKLPPEGVIMRERPEEVPSMLSYSGSKTVAVSMGSLRGLTINQPTRLNVSGNISETVKVTAMLSDENLPLQPEGTTEEIQDLDKVLIRVEGRNLSATLGDYEAGFGDTEFVLFTKMLEGAQAQGDFQRGGFNLLGAVSRGKSSTVTLQGIEGQNEYRIDVDGKYIIMIAGSESVWLNGEKMRRGEENDYIISDYGDPTIEFTNKHLITGKDIIVVDFEYLEEDLNYKQNLYGARGKLNIFDKGSSMPLNFGISYAIESDDKKNPLVILTDEDISRLERNEIMIDKIAPREHSVIGFDGNLDITENMGIKGELALSKRDLNTFSTYDKPIVGRAWKLKGYSLYDKFKINLDFRQLEPEFLPVGSNFSNRIRPKYQEDYENKSYGDIQPAMQTSPSGKTSYDLNILLRPWDYVELGGNGGKETNKYSKEPGIELPVSDSSMDYWGRSLKLAIPGLPKISTRYQEVTTKVGKKEELQKSRELWEVDYRFLKKMDIRARNENIGYSKISSNESSGNSRLERQLTFQIPELKKVSISGKYSFEEEFRDQKEPLSSAYTLSTDLTARPKSWLDFSGYFARRRFKRIEDTGGPASSTTNLTDLKLNLRPLRINYQIDRKLSKEHEEIYVNYILTRVEGREERRYLKPGEGNYVKIGEYTYREDMEKGDYIKIVRTVGDIPVTSLALQTVFSLQPRILFKKSRGRNNAFLDLLTNHLSIFEMGLRISEEQEKASRGFYLLQEIQTDKTIYGMNKYWLRTQLSPFKWLLLNGNWDTGATVNKRVNSSARRLDSDTWKIGVENPLRRNITIGFNWEEDNSQEKVSNLLKSEGIISHISEQQSSQTVFFNYRPVRILSRLKLEGRYEKERDEDITEGEPPVFTRTIAFRSEATWNFREVGTSIVEYEIARGNSSGKLPFARYDFHEGISHKISFKVDYRLKWFTDVLARMIYRAEISEDKKPDHRFEVEMTASF